MPTSKRPKALSPPPEPRPGWRLGLASSRLRRIALRSLGALALAALCSGGCSSRVVVPPGAPAAASNSPISAPTRAGAPTSPERVPVVLVPGITGSKLRDRESGNLIWGGGRQLTRPKDGGYSFVRPLADPIDQPSPSMEAFALLDRIRLFGVLSKPIYAPVVEALAAEGYRPGQVAAPTPENDLYLFPYDWRSDNILASRQLRTALEAIAATRPRPGGPDDPVEIDLICQSNGAHICRYLAKYGAVELEEAEAGRPRPLGSFAIRKIILVGTSNGGGMRILREVDRGRRYVPVVGRFMQPEVLFSFPAIFQDLPFYERKPFVDPRGRRLDVDLYDPEVWRRYGWSAFDAEAEKRMASRPDLFADPERRFEYLAQSLDRARRLHALLASDDPDDLFAREGSVPLYYQLQNGYYPTPHLAVLGDDGSLLFTGDRELKSRPHLAGLVGAPGDGHATVESQLALSPGELRATARDPYLVSGGHFELFLDPGVLRQLVLDLAEDRSAVGGSRAER